MITRRSYIGMDIHSKTTTCCVVSERGKFLQETTLATKEKVLRDFVKSISGERYLTFEEGCQAAWVYAFLEPLCDRILVCNPWKNKCLSGEQKTDKSDAYNLAEKLRGGFLEGVWHSGKVEQGLRDLAKTYDMVTSDMVRTKNRIKAIYRSRGIEIKETDVYNISKIEELIKKVPTEALKKRGEILYKELEKIKEIREKAGKAFVEEAMKHKIYNALQTIPQMGPIRAAIFIAHVGIPERFRTRKTFWSYVGLAVCSYASSEYEIDIKGNPIKKKGKQHTRGLVSSFNRPLKYVFKSMANQLKNNEWQEGYERLVKSGVRENMAVLTLARKAAAIALRIAKTGEVYDKKLVFQQKK